MMDLNSGVGMGRASWRLRNWLHMSIVLIYIDILQCINVKTWP
jgi:hypothetical protein